LFTECIDIRVEGRYDVGDKIGHNGCQYYVLEVGENAEEGLQELIVGK
jgi:sorbitol-specific phosphotransferase system component IIA